MISGCVWSGLESTFENRDRIIELRDTPCTASVHVCVSACEHTNTHTHTHSLSLSLSQLCSHATLLAQPSPQPSTRT